MVVLFFIFLRGGDVEREPRSTLIPLGVLSGPSGSLKVLELVPEVPREGDQCGRERALEECPPLGQVISIQ